MDRGNRSPQPPPQSRSGRAVAADPSCDIRRSIRPGAARRSAASRHRTADVRPPANPVRGMAARLASRGRRRRGRLLRRASRATVASGGDARALRRPHRERPGPAARSGLVAALVRAAHPNFVRVPGDRRRAMHGVRRSAATFGAGPPVRRTRRRVLLHNSRDEPVRIHVGKVNEVAGQPFEVFSDGPYEPPTARLDDLELRGWGCR